MPLPRGARRCSVAVRITTERVILKRREHGAAGVQHAADGGRALDDGARAACEIGIERGVGLDRIAEACGRDGQRDGSPRRRSIGRQRLELDRVAPRARDEGVVGEHTAGDPQRRRDRIAVEVAERAAVRRQRASLQPVVETDRGMMLDHAARQMHVGEESVHPDLRVIRFSTVAEDALLKIAMAVVDLESRPPATQSVPRVEHDGHRPGADGGERAVADIADPHDHELGAGLERDARSRLDRQRAVVLDRDRARDVVAGVGGRPGRSPRVRAMDVAGDVRACQRARIRAGAHGRGQDRPHQSVHRCGARECRGHGSEAMAHTAARTTRGHGGHDRLTCGRVHSRSDGP